MFKICFHKILIKHKKKTDFKLAFYVHYHLVIIVQSLNVTLNYILFNCIHLHAHNVIITLDSFGSGWVGPYWTHQYELLRLACL